MVAHNLRKCRPLIRQRAGFIVQQPGGIPTSGYSCSQSLRRQFHRIFIHNAPQHHIPAFHSGKPRRKVEWFRHGGVIEKSHRIAVTWHRPGVNDLPSQQCRQCISFMVTGDDLSRHGIRTSFPG